jgi:hypothetical protein
MDDLGDSFPGGGSAPRGPSTGADWGPGLCMIARTLPRPSASFGSSHAKEGADARVAPAHDGDGNMPTIAWFYGIAIQMHYNDHEPPHFHAR